MRKLYCSTGAIVGRLNGYNWHIVTEYIPRMQAEKVISGGELMMLPVYYEQTSAIADEWNGAGVSFPLIHCEKEVGTKLSDAAKAECEGDTDEAKNILALALDDFRKNCEMGAAVGAERMVLHLWGGYTSDAYILKNVEYLARLREIIRPYKIRLLVENVPSSSGDPIANWLRVLRGCRGEIGREYDVGFIFDTRFGYLHREISETWSVAELQSRIEHIHISDTKAKYREFSALRPIIHPREGEIDFPAFAALLDSVGYEGTITNESPVMTEGGADLPKLTDTLQYLQNLFGTHA